MKAKFIKKRKILILVVIILGVIVYLARNIYIQSLSQTSEPLMPQIIENVKDLMEDKVHPDNVVTTDSSFVWWISDDNYNIMNGNSFAVEAQFRCENYPASRYTASLETFASLFSKFMHEQGFSKNTMNSSSSLLDTRYYDYVQAYEEGDFKCTLTGDPDCSGSDENTMRQTIRFSCTSDFDENYKDQMPFLRDLRIKDAIVNISKRVGNYVYLDAHARRSGWYIIAIQQKGGTWKKIMDGQDSPQCSVMEQYKVPKEIYGSCL